MVSRDHPLVTRERVLVTVKAYPKPSNKYDELVCTAGITEDGSWVRIYPIPLQELEFSKFDWIELNLKNRSDDFRPETYEPANQPQIEDLEVVDHIETGPDRNWTARKEVCCQDTYYSLDQLIEDSKPPALVSLATFKPDKIVDLKVEEGDREWKEEWKKQRRAPDLFDSEEDRRRELIRKLPYEFRYQFRDKEGKESEMKIIDWEIGALYFNCLERAEGDEEVAVEKVRDKYLGDFTDRDTHLFLGTTKQYHGVAPNPFIVIGVFYPPEVKQGRMFADI